MPALLSTWQWLEYALLLLVGGALAWMEWQQPKRQAAPNRRRRWAVNLSLYALGAGLTLLVLEPMRQAAIRLGSLLLQGGGLGALALPGLFKVLLGIVLADAMQYWLHRLSHAIPLLWRLHQVHHADEVLDVSTAIRHHPLEALVLTALTLMLSAALGVPVLSLLIYALLQWTHALFCHANVALAVPLDRMLRYCIVTPDMHRVHHSARMDEGNRNFGMVFSWWDWVFHSYQAQPRAGHEGMVLGLATKQGQGVWASLVQPLHGVSDAAAEEQILR